MSPAILFIINIFLISTLVIADQIKLKFEPTPDATTSGLIWFNLNTYSKWSEKLDNYLEVYRTPSLTEGRSENLANCSDEKPITDNTVCSIKPDINSCTASNHFGYRLGTPCVYIELEKILDWKPKFFNTSKSLPKTMPLFLKEIITTSTYTPSKWKTIWLSCDGETAADKELIGPMNYYPSAGFPGYMFPYTGQSGYLNPIVAVQFVAPKTGIVINVVCKIWGPNIIHDFKTQMGVVKFSLLIDI
uniref:Secreted Na/K subunit 2-like protein n=1 Tax=Pristhesancus plagipennis TaxID=1955184 RepID=A0A2K8JV27_PRIPG|nr:secreted Na/K subunit 2-like protein [Pristhesancus plagipennis]